MSLQQNSPEVTILLPAYNEEEVVGKTVQHIKTLYPEYEILVINDGSTDTTAERAKQAGARVWSHPYNIGNGAAIKSGLRQAKGEWVVMMDADGQHPPEDIQRLLAYKEEYDMVVGARSRDSQTVWYRDLANIAYNTFASYVTKFRIKDLTSGFRLVRTAVARQFVYLLPNSFSYPTTLTMSYLRSGRTVTYIPITTKYRVGKSKIKIFQDGTRFFLIITRVATLFSPFRVFLPVSGLLFLGGGFNYLYTFLHAGRFTNMSALLFTASLITFMIGLVSEQITQMRYDRTE